MLVRSSIMEQKIHHELQKREQQLIEEEYATNTPLCFNARSYQMTHPGKLRPRPGVRMHKDADATVVSPMLVGVADGVSQLEQFGIDPSELPNELLRACEELAMNRLNPDRPGSSADVYSGPVSLLKDAYLATGSLGSTTVLLGMLDNSTRIHGTLHPMVAVLTLGDCELLMLRRLNGRDKPLQGIFHTETQRMKGHVQTPLQVARVDDRIDPEFNEDIALDVIERGSAVHCVSTYEGDIVLLGSDGVFDNLFLDEIIGICNIYMPPPARGSEFQPMQPSILSQIAQRIVQESHEKARRAPKGFLQDTPRGMGGKMDDTSVVVAEVVEWTEAHSKLWAQVRRDRQWDDLVTCNGALVRWAERTCGGQRMEEYEEVEVHSH